MEKLGLLLAFITLPASLFFTIAKINGGNLIVSMLIKLFGIMGTVLSVIYILKYYNFI